MCCLLQSSWRWLNEAKLSQTALFQLSSRACQQRCCLLLSGWRLEWREYIWISHVSQQNQAGLQDSYIVALRIAQQKKLYNIGEQLILPCCKDIVRCMIGDGAETKLSLVPLSNNTIQRRISEIVEDTAGCCWDTTCATQNVCNPAAWVNRCSKVCPTSCSWMSQQM